MNSAKASASIRDSIRHALHHHPPAIESEDERRTLHRRQVEALIYFCWGLIVLKCFAVVWAVNYFNIPFNPLWVVAPTLAFALLATASYFWLRER